MPGSSVAKYFPKRSIMRVSLCGIITIAILTNTTAKTTKLITTYNTMIICFIKGLKIF